MSTLQEQMAQAVEHHRHGRLTEAVRIYTQVLQIVPNHASANHLVGLAAHQQGKHDLAIEHIQRAIAIDAGHAMFHNNLGAAYLALEKIPEAVSSFQRAVQLKPDYAEGNNNLGNALRFQGRLSEAENCYRQATRCDPNYASAHYNLGNLLQELGRVDEARQCHEHALRLKPDFADAHSSLGSALRRQGKTSEAIACHERALQLNPRSSEAHNNLGNVLQDQGRFVEAAECYQRALECAPGFVKAHSNWLFALNYNPQVSLAQLQAAHAEFDRRHAEPLRAAWRSHEQSRDPDRPLRVGFVSSDLGTHPVGYYLARTLESLDRRSVEAWCYSDRPTPDAMTERCRAASTQFKAIAGMPHVQLADLIHADRIDILFDLAGHTARNRLMAFARKPAPIQISWIGYVGTTGLAAMDYLLADRYLIPVSAEPYYRERVLRMPDSYICYLPPAEAPDVGPLPAKTPGQVTFASFNNPSKITASVIALWARILQRLPQSRLMLKYRGLEDPSVRQRLQLLFNREGIESNRLDIQGHSPYREFLALYNQVDITLDPFPHTGGLTTCESLWMGVPVVTCPGETFASRQGLSHLSNIGITETVAHDHADYVRLATELATDLPRLQKIRAGLRDRLTRSPLCDAPRFAVQFTDLLRGVWREWCARR